MILRLLFSFVPRFVALVFLLGGIGCDGGRSPQWGADVDPSQPTFGLAGLVAIPDPPANRVVALTAGADQTLTTTPIPTGRGIVNAAALPDGSKLVVLSAGHRAKLGDDVAAESPSLTLIDGTTAAASRFDLGGVLSDPLTGLALDPLGHWAVLFAGASKQGAFVENPNELVIVDLTQPPAKDSNPVAHTLQSFGGRPVRFTFTAPLNLPTGMRRLLIVESDQDLSILELDHPAAPEITVPLTSGTDARQLQPAGVVVDDGDPARNDDARIGVRVNNDRNVVTLTLAPADGGHGFRPTVNLTDVGGVPSDIAFVRTDGGLRLAALVPGTRSAVLIDPLTSITTPVALPASYARLSLVTGAVAAASSSDVALLWNSTVEGQGVAFWSLGQTAGQPYRSVETVGVSAAIEAVFDVPTPNQTLKILSTANSNSFFVLDLKTRTAAPLTTLSSGVDLTVSPGGKRVWTFAPQGTQLAVTDLATKHPRSLLVERPIAAVHEIARSDGGRALIAVHGQGDLGATVFDAETQDDQTRRLYAGLLTGGPYNGQ